MTLFLAETYLQNRSLGFPPSNVTMITLPNGGGTKPFPTTLRSAAAWALEIDEAQIEIAREFPRHDDDLEYNALVDQGVMEDTLRLFNDAPLEEHGESTAGKTGTKGRRSGKKKGQRKKRGKTSGKKRRLGEDVDELDESIASVEDDSDCKTSVSIIPITSALPKRAAYPALRPSRTRTTA